MSDDLFGQLKQVRADLADLGYGCALVGGLAIGLQTRPRTTADVDLVVAVDADEDAEGIIMSLRERGYNPRVPIEHIKKKRLATVRFVLPGSNSLTPTIDLLFASSGIEPEVVQAAISLNCGAAGPIPVARVGHLIALKVLSESKVREQDRVDLKALLRVASAEELRLAHQAIGIINDRGYHRDKDLAATLQSFLRETA